MDWKWFFSNLPDSQATIFHPLYMIACIALNIQLFNLALEGFFSVFVWVAFIEGCFASLQDLFKALLSVTCRWKPPVLLRACNFSRVHSADTPSHKWNWQHKLSCSCNCSWRPVLPSPLSVQLTNTAFAIQSFACATYTTLERLQVYRVLCTTIIHHHYDCEHIESFRHEQSKLHQLANSRNSNLWLFL